MAEMFTEIAEKVRKRMKGQRMQFDDSMHAAAHHRAMNIVQLTVVDGAALCA